MFLRRLLTCELLRVSKTASIVTFLYILLAIASVAAIVVITIQFAQDVRNPESGIELVQHDRLPMPVVTVCSTQTGVPLRRLQFFTFRNALGVVVEGPRPRSVTGSDEFEAVVERFWDNPNKEDCDRVCGNFFPLPAEQLQGISNGSVSTKCRPCFRTGSKGPEVVATSTAFSDSAFMDLYTDHAFFQVRSSHPLRGCSWSSCVAGCCQLWLWTQRPRGLARIDRRLVTLTHKLLMCCVRMDNALCYGCFLFPLCCVLVAPTVHVPTRRCGRHCQRLDAQDGGDCWECGTVLWGH